MDLVKRHNKDYQRHFAMLPFNNGVREIVRNLSTKKSAHQSPSVVIMYIDF